jgi:hypothetical protein
LDLGAVSPPPRFREVVREELSEHVDNAEVERRLVDRL